MAARNACRDLAGERGADDARAEAQHVHVVVLDRLMRGVGVVAHRRANAGELVRGNRDAGAAAADDDAALGLPVAQGVGDRFGGIGIIHRRGRMGAEIEDIVALLSQFCGQFLLQHIPCVVGTEGDSHGYNLSHAHYSYVLAAGLFGLLTGGASSSPVAHAQAPAARPQGAAPAQPTFRVSVDLVTTDVIVRDRRGPVRRRPQGRRVRGLRGRRQAGDRLAHADARRARLQRAEPAAGAGAGRHHPAAEPADQRRGRPHLPDLHRRPPSGLPQHAAHARSDQADARALIHEGDMFGIVSTGTSSISEQLTYDRQVLDRRSRRVTGGGLQAEGDHRGHAGLAGPTELRHRAHVAFSTAYD